MGLPRYTYLFVIYISCVESYLLAIMCGCFFQYPWTKLIQIIPLKMFKILPQYLYLWSKTYVVLRSMLYMEMYTLWNNVDFNWRVTQCTEQTFNHKSFVQVVRQKLIVYTSSLTRKSTDIIIREPNYVTGPFISRWKFQMWASNLSSIITYSEHPDHKYC